MNIGEKIKYLREKKGYTLEELGEKIGVGKSTVRKWENGMIKNMRRDKISKLAEVLDCSPLYLLGYDETSSLNGEAEKLTNKEREFVTLFSSIPADQQELIVDLIKTFLSKQ